MTNREAISAIIVDDEQDASENLNNIIYNYTDRAYPIEIMGIAHNTQQAEVLINKFKPEVVFLDIEMPKENAFQFLERIAPFNFEIIFITAYDEFAIKAFRINALDYILKPISVVEINNALRKLTEKVANNRLLSDKELFKDLSKNISQKKAQNFLRLRTTNKIEMVHFSDVVYIEAKGAYSKFYFYQDGVVKQIIVSHPISEYEDIVPTDTFYRIHKSYLVNCRQIQNVCLGANPEIIMNSDITLPVSRRRSNAFVEFMESINQG